MEMLVDYRKQSPGVAMAKDVMMSACPLCDATCHRVEGRIIIQYVHAVLMRKPTINAPVSVTPKFECRETRAQREERTKKAV
jgi:hypothetical protein